MRFKREDGDDKPIFARLGSLNFIEFIACCLNSMIGTGALKLGSAFTSGILFTHILNIFVALVSLYSLKLYVLSASCFHESTFEEIWTSTFSRTTVAIPAICSILSSISNIMSYLSFLQDSVITIISMVLKMIMENPDDVIQRLQEFRLLIGFLIVIVFLVPTSISNNLRHVVIVSFISVSLFFVILLYVVIRFIILVVNNGFDPDNRFKLVDLKDHVSGSISSLAFAYLFYPFAWPGLRHSKNPSLNNLSKTFYATIGICCVLYAIMGTFSYLSFFDQNTGGLIFDYYPDNTHSEAILLIFGHVVTFFYILLTVPIVLNSARYIFLNTLHKKDDFSNDVWAPLGITMSLMSLVLANATETLSDYIYILSDLLTLIQLFILPPIFYLRGYGSKIKLHLIGSILELILGVAAVAFMIYADCFE